MALGTNHITTTSGDVYIPELWSNEVVAAYKANLVLANLVTNLNFEGKKGAIINIPEGTRGSATAKSQEAAVTFITAVETDVNLTIDQHFHYARVFDDLYTIQALPSLRQFYTDDAGYALAIQVENYLWGRSYALGGGTAGTTVSGVTGDFGTGAFSGADGTTAFDASADTGIGALTDAAIRRSIQRLDDNNVPLSDRALVVPPIEKRNLTGLPRFTEQAFVGEAGGANTIRNGLVGDIYGIPVYVSSNCPTDTDGSVDARMVLLLHKSALVLATQMAVRTQTSYELEFLADVFVADTIFGAIELRDTSGVKLAVAAS